MSEAKERNFLVGIFGENFDHRQLIGQALGAPGTKSDILFFNRLNEEAGHVFCAMTPIDYPDKIKPFLQVLKISDIHLLVIDLELGLNATVGEILIGMDLYHQLFKTECLVVLAGISSKNKWKLEQIENEVENILNSTSLKGTEIFKLNDKEDYETLKQKIVELGLRLPDPELEMAPYSKILIDHVFPVKGIGTVILGIVKRGSINTRQLVELIGYEGPSAGKKIIIRSIQKHDREFKVAHEGDRVGLALKGNISPNDISRDNIIVSQGRFKHEKEIKAKVYLNQFYKPKEGKIKPGDGIQYHSFVELKGSPFKFSQGDNLIPGESGILTLNFDKSLVHDGSGLKGIIADLNRFENKLRILGYYIQVLD
jgi:selenocysteine-specific translation elongation factor